MASPPPSAPPPEYERPPSFNPAAAYGGGKMQYEPPPPSSHVPTVHATPATGSTSPPQQPAFNPGEKRRFPRFPSFPRKTGLSSLSFSSMSSSFHVAAAYGGEYGSAPPSYPPPGGHSEPQVVYVPVYRINVD